MKKSLKRARSQIYNFVKMISIKITYALGDWIREWRKYRNEDPTLDDCIKLVDWKLENYKLTNRDMIIVENILLYETKES